MAGGARREQRAAVGGAFRAWACVSPRRIALPARRGGGEPRRRSRGRDFERWPGARLRDWDGRNVGRPRAAPGGAYVAGRMANRGGLRRAGNEAGAAGGVEPYACDGGEGVRYAELGS